MFDVVGILGKVNNDFTDTRQVIIIAAAILTVLLLITVALLIISLKNRKRVREGSIFLGRKNMYKDRTRRKHKF